MNWGIGLASPGLPRTGYLSVCFCFLLVIVLVLLNLICAVSHKFTSIAMEILLYLSPSDWMSPKVLWLKCGETPKSLLLTLMSCHLKTNKDVSGSGHQALIREFVSFFWVLFAFFGDIRQRWSHHFMLTPSGNWNTYWHLHSILFKRDLSEV